MSWNGNLGSSIGKSARLVIWRSEVLIPVQGKKNFHLKSKFIYIYNLFMYRITLFAHLLAPKVFILFFFSILVSQRTKFKIIPTITYLKTNILSYKLSL